MADVSRLKLLRLELRDVREGLQAVTDPEESANYALVARELTEAIKAEKERSRHPRR